jgi:hypothetical protein
MMSEILQPGALGIMTSPRERVAALVIGYSNKPAVLLVRQEEASAAFELGLFSFLSVAVRAPETSEEAMSRLAAQFSEKLRSICSSLVDGISISPSKLIPLATKSTQDFGPLTKVYEVSYL